MVLGREQETERRRHPFAQAVPIGIERFTKTLFQLADRQWRIRCDSPRQFHGRRHEVVVRNHTGNEPQRTSPFRVDDLTGELQFRSGFAPDDLSQPPDSRCIADQPAFDEELPELGSLTCYANVSHQCEFHPPSDCSPIHSSDDRHITMKERVSCRRESRSAIVRTDCGRTTFLPRPHDQSNIVSAAERRVGSGDDETPNRTVMHGMRGRFDRGIHLVRERISLFGSVESQNPDSGSIGTFMHREPNITPGQFSRRLHHFAPQTPCLPTGSMLRRLEISAADP
jgi:hypothetical protein